MVFRQSWIFEFFNKSRAMCLFHFVKMEWNGTCRINRKGYIKIQAFSLLVIALRFFFFYKIEIKVEFTITKPENSCSHYEV